MCYFLTLIDVESVSVCILALHCVIPDNLSVQQRAYPTEGIHLREPKQRSVKWIPSAEEHLRRKYTLSGMTRWCLIGQRFFQHN